jgi:DNA-binding response OmpR family regulator
MLPSVSPTPTLLPPPELLFVDGDTTTATFLPMLRDQYRLTVTATAGAALQALGRTPPALVVMELDLSDGPGEEICRRAKALTTPATVLVTTPQAERVPSALVAGCDAVLLKPFAPNLLYARLGRLLRARSVELRMRAHRQQAKSLHLKEQGELLAARTNREWSNTHCPYCQHRGVTSFEYTSHRRAWYACLECKKVWIAHRQE